ncbi:hypothetical protein BK665_28860 [Pseudomonas frederiksbergensis]|uniref:Glycosyltransferase RgtA/B/C/D-like domain-containing protein n=2 Tax=Pseudomonas frederiksbergensis TaxID=104087 RepID=A0A423K565_9PSED|nr:hypothetical protein BK665_28860 [Pseudomonas frederiksbergensis]
MYVLLLMIVVLGAAFRSYKLFDKSLWMDELFSAWASDPENDLSTVFHRTVEDVHPPLYQILLWCVYKVFGYGERVGRVFSMLLGVAVIPAMYALGVKLFSSSVGLLVAWLSAINFYLIFFSQNTRSYELLVLMTILSFVAFVCFLRKVNAVTALLYALVSAALVNTHYFGVLLVVSQAMFLLCELFRSGFNGRMLLLGAGAGGLIVLSLAPTMSFMLDNFKKKDSWIPRPDNQFIVDTWVLPFGDLSVALVCTLLFLVGLNAMVRRSDDRGSAGILLCWWLIGFAVAYVRSMFYTPIFSLKNAIVFVPAILVIVAYGVDFVEDRFVKGVFVVFISVVSSSYFLTQPSVPEALRLQHDLRAPTLKVISDGRNMPVYARFSTEHITYSKLLGAPIDVSNLETVEARLKAGQTPFCFYVIADQWDRARINNYPAQFGVSLIHTAEFENSAVLEYCSGTSPTSRP